MLDIKEFYQMFFLTLKFFSDFHRYAWVFCQFPFSWLCGIFFLFHFIHFKCYIYPEKNGIERAYIDHFYIIQCFPNVCMCGGWGKYWRKEKRINIYEQTKWNQELGDYCLNYTLKKSNISQPRKIQCYSESLWIMKIFIILKHILQKKMVENQ